MVHVNGAAHAVISLQQPLEYPRVCIAWGFISLLRVQMIPYKAGADPGGSLGSRDPPPEIYQGSQKNGVLV